MKNNKNMNMSQMVGYFSNMIHVAVNNMAAGKKAIPADVIKATGTTRIRPDTCEPHRGFLGWGYCDPYFGWLTPALEEATLLLGADLTEDTAVQLWENGWTRAFLVELFERNNESWELGEDGPELYDKLEFNIRTRKGFIDWLMSGELYGFNLPGHQNILQTKEALLLRNRKKKVSGD